MIRVLIFGATSAIAEATARLYANRGAHLFLVGRNGERLAAIARDLEVRGASSAHTFVLDALDIDRHSAMLDEAWRALGGVDVALIAHGTLPDQAACALSVQASLHEFSTNATSVIALCTALAMRLEAPASLAVISSVAGDRGRASNYLYGSAKAAVSAFTSGLRQSLGRTGVNVLTIKPGFVDTPMTTNFRKGLLWASPGSIAAGIVKAIDRRRGVVYLPWFWWGIMWLISHIPEPLFRRIRL